VSEWEWAWRAQETIIKSIKSIIFIDFIRDFRSFLDECKVRPCPSQVMREDSTDYSLQKTAKININFIGILAVFWHIILLYGGW